MPKYWLETQEAGIMLDELQSPVCPTQMYHTFNMNKLSLNFNKNYSKFGLPSTLVGCINVIYSSLTSKMA